MTESKNEGMIFIPNPLTGVRKAQIFDCEYNRRMLATHLEEGRWTIDDPAILQNVTELRKEIMAEVNKTEQPKPSIGSQPVTPVTTTT